MNDNIIRKLVAEELAIKGENDFVKEVYANDMRDPLDILNWYRNLYYKEGLDTERGLMANAINDLFMQMNTRTERIVDRLEQQKQQYKRRSEEAKYPLERDHFFGKMCSYDHAIKIVKAGGADEVD